MHQTCHSTKRTHFIFADFFPYQLYLQELLLFAGAFANGFVLEKRTHLGRIFYGVPAAVSTYSDLRLRREEPRDADAMERGRKESWKCRLQEWALLWWEILRFAQDDRSFVGSKRGRIGDLLSKSPTLPLS